VHAERTQLWGHARNPQIKGEKKNGKAYCAWKFVRVRHEGESSLGRSRGRKIPSPFISDGTWCICQLRWREREKKKKNGEGRLRGLEDPEKEGVTGSH